MTGYVASDFTDEKITEMAGRLNVENKYDARIINELLGFRSAENNHTSRSLASNTNKESTCSVNMLDRSDDEEEEKFDNQMWFKHLYIYLGVGVLGFWGLLLSLHG